MRRPTILAALLWSLWALGAPAVSADIVAGSADDVCAPGVDPCNVTTRVEILNNSELDFGLRTLNVTGNGKLDFLDRHAKVLAGPVTIGGKGLGMVSGGIGAVAEIRARRGCSALPQHVCLGPAECEIGPCSMSSTCVHDASVACSSNADCSLGTCSVGAGTLSLDTAVSAGASFAANLTLVASGDIAVNVPINVSGTTLSSDGGSVGLDSRSGSVTLAAPIDAGGGGEAVGGWVSVDAGQDILLNGAIDATGGDSDGGAVSATAGNDLTIWAGINASSVSGAGYGGDIDLAAGRDMRIGGDSAGQTAALLSLGHKTSVLPIESGDGGDITLAADRNMTLSQYGSAISRGAQPEGYGGDLDLWAGEQFSLAGQVRSNADGNSGDGGTIALAGDLSVVVASTAVVEVDGGNGGYVSVDSYGPVQLGGSWLLGARVTGGVAGSIDVTSDADLVMTGSISAAKSSGEVNIEACRVTLQSGASIANITVDGVTTLLCRESMKLLAGSSVTGKASGTNTLIYRSPDKPPLIQGTVSPAPDLVLDEALEGCPVCGNGEVDQSETCDDGNTANGDGCNSDCQVEACVAQTVGGYPNNPLCYDANDCTVDTCDAQAKTCRHVVDCGDGVDCTVDTCQGTSCVHAPSAALCNDGNFCNGAEVCDAQTGCGPGTPPNCDDGIGCTEDSCSSAQGACVHTAHDEVCSDGNFCNGAEVCNVQTGCGPGTPPNCGDAVACTVDSCNSALGACQHLPDDAACDDADQCTSDTCDVADGCLYTPSGLPGCTTTTTLPPPLCGDADGDGSILASDALLALRTAVGSWDCAMDVCDVDDNFVITAADALLILRVAVGESLELQCPPPAAFWFGVPDVSTTTTTTTTTEESSTTLPLRPGAPAPMRR